MICIYSRHEQCAYIQHEQKWHACSCNTLGKSTRAALDSGAHKHALTFTERLRGHLGVGQVETAMTSSCVFSCACFHVFPALMRCVCTVYFYIIYVYTERERERMNHRNALCMPLFHHVWLPSCRPPSLSFLSGIFLFFFSDQSVSPPSFSSHQLSPHPPLWAGSPFAPALPSSASFISSLLPLHHFLFLNIFYPHLMPSSPCYICAVHSSFCGCLSLVCLFPFDLPPNDSRLLFVRFRAWIWVCVQAHTCTSQFESVNDCPLRVQHAVYRASHFLSRTCCMIITLCSPDVFVTIHHFAFFIIIFFLFPTFFFIIIFVCLRAYGSNTLPYLTYICALVFLCVTVPVGSCILYFVSEAKPTRAAH